MFVKDMRIIWAEVHVERERERERGEKRSQLSDLDNQT